MEFSVNIFSRAKVVLLTATLFLVASPGFAQQQLSISGTVRDESTGVVPGATVVLTAGGTQVGEATTDGSGVYRFNGLTARSYELSFTMPNYEPMTRNVSLGPDTPPIDVVLSVGRISTTLTVEAVAGRATATRLPVANQDVPAQVTSIPRELIRQQAANTLGEVVKNASGVTAVRQYGAYEQLMIRGFFEPDRDAFNVTLVDGMRFSGNRYATQTYNIESVEILKGPSSVLYGRGAVGGSVNLILRKPEAAPAYELSYKAGSYNTHQFTGGATGPIGSSGRVLYRVDGSFETSSGWRDAGGDRFGVTPSLTWNISDRSRLSLRQSFTRDRFDGDGTIPYDIVGLPAYKPELNIGLEQDNVLVEDSQTHVLFNQNLSPRWQFRNSLFYQRTSDRYFVTEYSYSEGNTVYREPLDFHHNRRPFQNQAEVMGRFDGFGSHVLLLGYEYQNDDFRNETSAGDDPCTCGYWWETIAPIDISTMVETQGPLDINTVARRRSFTDRVHAVYWQDQIDVAPQMKLNLAGRFDDYEFSRDTVYVNEPSRNNTVRQAQTAYTYRAGIVYSPRFDQQLYFGTSTSFSTQPSMGEIYNEADLAPSTGRNYEVGHRWQGWAGRVNTNVAYYHTTRNNLSVFETPIDYTQVGEQISQGLDLDVNTDLGGRTHLIVNYGYNNTNFEDAGDLNGKDPRYVPHNTFNTWLRKDWASGLNASFGVQYVGSRYFNSGNTLLIGDYTIASAAVGYRARAWEWTLNLDNLFDEDQYFLPGNYTGQVLPGPPFAVSSTIRLRLN